MPGGDEGFWERFADPSDKYLHLPNTDIFRQVKWRSHPPELHLQCQAGYPSKDTRPNLRLYRFDLTVVSQHHRECRFLGVTQTRKVAITDEQAVCLWH